MVQVNIWQVRGQRSLTIVSLISSTTYTSDILCASGWNPPYIAPLLSPRDTMEKLLQGGGASPVTSGTTHLPEM